MQPKTARLLVLLVLGSSSSPRYLESISALSFYPTNCSGGANTPILHGGKKIYNEVCTTSFQSSSPLSARHAIPNSRMAAVSSGHSEASSINRGRDIPGSSPNLAILTEPDSCDDEIRMEETFRAVQKAVSPISATDSSEENGGNGEKWNGVTLISIRVSNPNGNGYNDEDGSFQKRVVELTRRIVSLRNEQNRSRRHSFHVVVNDNVQAAIDAGADGVHVKEKNAHEIPNVRRRMIQHRQLVSKDQSDDDGDEDRGVLIGTSSHALSTALSTVRNFQPDYLFVGTCYHTQTHPEKVVDDLEGPELPGMVKEALHRDLFTDGDDGALEGGRDTNKRPPVVYAIGGIDEHNCREPVRKYGADGVAVIRSVMQAEDPGSVVRAMRDRMMAE